MIVSLLYLTTFRPNIMHVVSMVARFQDTPNENYVKAVKRIFNYLQHTKDYGLWYPNGKDFDYMPI